MLDMEEVANSIYNLENNLDTTRENCILLASLYLIQSNYKNHIENKVENELGDILPAYRRYCEIKRRYQLKEANSSEVIHFMKHVCGELGDLIRVIYSGTDMPEERECLTQMLSSISI